MLPLHARVIQSVPFGNQLWSGRAALQERYRRGRGPTRDVIEVCSRQHRSGPSRHRQIALGHGSFEATSGRRALLVQPTSRAVPPGGMLCP